MYDEAIVPTINATFKKKNQYGLSAFHSKDKRKKRIKMGYGALRATADLACLGTNYLLKISWENVRFHRSDGRQPEK